MNPLFRIDFSISDSLKIVRKSVLIYETIIVRVGYGAQDAKRVEVNNTGTGKLWTTGTCVRFMFLYVIISTFLSAVRQFETAFQ